MNKYESIGLALEFTRYLATHPDARTELAALYSEGQDLARADELAAELVSRSLHLDRELRAFDMAEFKAGMREVHAVEAPPPPWTTLQNIATYHSGGDHV